jgi:hypothetical protein
MPAVTRSSARRARVVARIQRRLIGGSRVSPRLAARRWVAVEEYSNENLRDVTRFNRRLMGYIWERMTTAADTRSAARFDRHLVRLMARFPEIVDACPEMRRMLSAAREMRQLDGQPLGRISAVYRRIGSTGYYTL